MKVSKTSWHYKVLTGCTGIKPSQSLCVYFWQVMFATVFAAPILLMLLGVFLLMEGLKWLAVKSVKPVTALGAWAWSLFPEKRQKQPNDPPPFSPPKEPGLLRSWLTAKKEKVCPLIEFTDESRRDSSNG